jgi:hypothetical protein
MSGVTHPQISIKEVLVRDQRRAKIIAAAVATAITALLATLVLVLDGGTGPTAASEQQAAQAPQGRGVPAGIRYDGGPEEGSHAVRSQLPAGLRYDGGPEEGTAALTRRSAPATFDPNSIKEAPGIRYDGGPEEGTSGAGR